MEWLNYHHLLYFWTVVREGSLAAAADKLHLSQPTVSAQVRALERSLGEKLFAKEGRRLVLTEMGRLVYGYAGEIFTLGRELLDTVHGRPTGRPLRLVVGVADVVPKIVAKRLLDPARSAGETMHLVCREGKPDRLLADLAAHALDVVLLDGPLAPGSAVRAFSHLLGESGTTLFAAKGTAGPYRKRFPAGLDGAPMLLPTDASSARRSLDQWFASHRVQPRVMAEFDDSALLKVFGQDGWGVFPGTTALEREIRRQYGVDIVGRLPEVRQRFYAITVDRRIKHPAVVAICQEARDRLFAGES